MHYHVELCAQNVGMQGVATDPPTCRAVCVAAAHRSVKHWCGTVAPLQRYSIGLVLTSLRTGVQLLCEICMGAVLRSGTIFDERGVRVLLPAVKHFARRAEHS